MDKLTLTRIPFQDDRYASYEIPPSQFGKPALLVVRMGPFSTAINVDLAVMTPADFRAQTQSDLLMIGFVSGIVGIMALYNLGMLLLFRKAYLFYYTVYTVSAFYWFYMMSGFGPLSTLTVLSIHVASGLIQACTILFSFDVLNARKDFPRLNRLAHASIVWSGLTLFGVLLGRDAPVYLFYANIPFSFLLCFRLALKASLRGDRSASAMLLG